MNSLKLNPGAQLRDLCPWGTKVIEIGPLFR